MKDCDIQVRKLDDVYLQIGTSPAILEEISETFTFESENVKFHPAYKARKWDGKTRLFSTKSQKLYIGLLPHLCIFAANEGYTVDVHNDVPLPSKRMSEEDVKKFFMDVLSVASKGELLTPRDYQVEAFRHCVSAKRCVIEAATASGKSLTIYALSRLYADLIPKDKKILIIVPSVGLVHQMVDDFKDYSTVNKWNAAKHCHMIFGGQSKFDIQSKIVVSTYQSIYDLSAKYFSQFDVIIGDEAHKFAAKTLKGIMHKAKNCRHKFAFTGTLHDSKCNRLVVEGLFGMSKQVVTAREMIDAGDAPDIEINCLLLTYPESMRKIVKGMTYHEERHYIATLPQRNRFIFDLGEKLKGNTLVLVDLVKDHGQPLYEYFKTNSKKKIYLVVGDTDSYEREEVRRIIENEDNAIIVASFGVFATGISIKKLHNVIFAGSPGKGKIRVVQSIGRQLRQHATKKTAKLYDIGDDFSTKKRKNFMLRHMAERINIYIREDHPYKVIPITMTE